MPETYFLNTSFVISWIVMALVVAIDLYLHPKRQTSRKCLLILFVCLLAMLSADLFVPDPSFIPFHAFFRISLYACSFIVFFIAVADMIFNFSAPAKSHD